MKFTPYLYIFLFLSTVSFSQNISGSIINKSTKKPVEYVNIGVPGKGIGTVSNEQGKFTLTIDSAHRQETILFSCVGYNPVSIKISELAGSSNYIEMQEANYNLNEVVIKPKNMKEKMLGIKTTAKSVLAGFKENNLGYELGIMMKNKKMAYLKTVNINIASCTYDTIFYRLNVYKSKGNNEFENVLKEPIYIKIAREQVKETISIDLKSKNITVEGDFLVSLEHVRDLGSGGLMFCSSLGKRTYFRNTSQGAWESISMAGVSISVLADVEK